MGHQKRCCVPLGQRQGTHVCNDSPVTLGAWLGSFNTSTIYISHLAPCDCLLVLALQNFLSDNKFGSREDCENRLLELFAYKDLFYERDIMKLLLKWQQIIQQNGEYLTQIEQSEVC
ncbi:hypothetical protein TNCV_4714591 [Trichonephila clavipes]|nr:hypothetical protein TNCV_4714591 [Trichonephila clavipes]